MSHLAREDISMNSWNSWHSTNQILEDSLSSRRGGVCGKAIGFNVCSFSDLLHEAQSVDSTLFQIIVSPVLCSYRFVRFDDSGGALLRVKQLLTAKVGR